VRPLDWGVMVVYSLLALCIGLYFTRRASRGIEGYFVGGRSLPWWAIGFSTVATFTSAGSASAFTMLVFSGGLLGNWWWWIPWVIWMPLVAVIWSKFWRRLKIVSTAEFVQVRYGGRAASVFRSVAAIYFSFGWAVVLMAYVTGWLTKSVGPILGWRNSSIILFAATLTLSYTVLGGLLGAVYSEVFQFAFFVVSNVIFIPFIIHRLGGLHHIYANVEHNYGASFFHATPPGGDFTGLTIFALVLQGLFFAASPAGGEGFTAQKFMAAKNEFHAQVGQLFNAFLSLVVRVIPFFFLGIIAASVFPHGSVEGERIWGELVKRFGFSGLTGILVAGEFASYQSAVSTEMNWGASYLINDLYKRLIKKDGSERHYVWASRIATFVLLALSLIVGGLMVKGMMAWFLFINNVMIAFILPLAWLRFFWWRLNIWGEIAALVGGLPLSYAIWFPLGFAHKPFWQGFLLLFGSGWLVILAVTMLTPPEKQETLEKFYRLCQPPGFWGKVTSTLPHSQRLRIRRDLRADIYECALGVAFCTASVALVANLFARHWLSSGEFAVVGAVAFTIFVRRWLKRGVFSSLAAGPSPGAALPNQ
jgi:SSS family solute:Na+ symporter